MVFSLKGSPRVALRVQDIRLNQIRNDKVINVKSLVEAWSESSHYEGSFLEQPNIFTPYLLL
jgi:hypothetical protein